MKLRKRHDGSTSAKQNSNGRDLWDANLGRRRNLEWSAGDDRIRGSDRDRNSSWAVATSKNLVAVNTATPEWCAAESRKIEGG